MIPLLLNLTGRLCVVVGGGSVGRRKATTLLEGGAHVRLIAREDRPQQETSAALEWLTQSYRSEHLDGATLVVAAADPEVNRQVVADAKARGVWVNAADDPESGDFFMPAVVRRGDFVIAVGTGGNAPALACDIRQRLEEQFDESFGIWVALLAELRPLILARIAEPQQRRLMLEWLCRWDWLECLRRQNADEVRSAMLAEIQALAGNRDHPL
jgi:precorrin-2 dehydrogenase/sirohydrochlorin ferrochelatase